MSRLLVPLVLILALSFLPCFCKSASAFKTEPVPKAQASVQPSKNAGGRNSVSVHTPVSVQTQRTITNIVFDKMENGFIYSKDGRKFQVGGSTRIFKNINPESKTRLAELAFENGNLVSVNIK